MNRNSKIIATIGPSIRNKEDIKNLIMNGMNVMRINFSHIDYEDAQKRIRCLGELNKEFNTFVPWLCDTKGPEIRVNKIENDAIVLDKNDIIKIVSNEVIGNKERFSTTYHDLYQYVKKDDCILINDGLVVLQVQEIIDTQIICLVVFCGEINTNKGVNVPHADLKMTYLSTKDIYDINFACEHHASYIAASFVRNQEDVKLVRDLCTQNDRKDMKIIAKIENQQGIDNIDEILACADGIMVARGDLGSEINMEDVPLAQYELCKKANNVGKPVIVATHMLDSMERNPRPTRAEAGDVSRAIIDGADAVMLSGETARGSYPILAVEAMAKIATKSESVIDHDKILRNHLSDIDYNPYDGIGLSAVELANKIDAKGIFCFTTTGETALKISKYRPQCPIYALSYGESTLYSLALYWGVKGIKKGIYTELDEKQDIVNIEAKRLGLKVNDYVIITGGYPDKARYTNFLIIHQIQ
ncbi:MAG: pyruvate kinase [Bacilli bacterium]|jgi:pyruvate kinase|nr:pyruvate kinase [Bacilli bacterium]